jgi:signal transduction histidine kinase
LINLVGNALKFTDSGEVEISVSQDLQRGDQTILHFRVRDSGRGIPKEHHQRVFEAFVQADGSMKRAETRLWRKRLGPGHPLPPGDHDGRRDLAGQRTGRPIPLLRCRVRS